MTAHPQQLHAREFPVSQVPGDLEELEVLALGNEPPLDPVHRIADLAALHDSGEGIEDAAKRGFELRLVLDELPILENDDQELVVRENAWQTPRTRPDDRYRAMERVSRYDGGSGCR